MTPTDPYDHAAGRYRDPEGDWWDVVNSFLEPLEVDRLVADGVPVLRHDCVGLSVPESVDARTARRELIPHLLDSRRRERKERRKGGVGGYIPHLFTRGDRRLVILIEHTSVLAPAP